MTQTTIGIPRALLYHRYGVLWATFFERLGCRIVLSPHSNRRILERGIALAVDETCLPLKVFLGHVDALKGKCDYILVPRVASLRKDEQACVKLMAAYDIAANSVEDVRLIGYSVDVESRNYEFVEMLRLGSRFSRNPVRLVRAYLAAKRAEESDTHRRALEEESKLAADGLKVLVVGHSYNLVDESVGKPLVEYLEKLDVTVISSEDVDTTDALPAARKLSRDVYWTYNIEQLAAVERCRDRVDGIIFLVTFPCGPDSLVTELCARAISEPPLITIVLDELQAEAGMRTRLESFVDIVRMRKDSAARAAEEAITCAAS